MNRATLAHSGISATLLYLIKSWQGCRPCSSPVLGKEGKSSATARDANAAEQACCPAKQGGRRGFFGISYGTEAVVSCDEISEG